MDIITEYITQIVIFCGTLFGTGFGTYKGVNKYYTTKSVNGNGTKASLKYLEKEIEELKVDKMGKEACKEREKAITASLNDIKKDVEYIRKRIDIINIGKVI